MTQPPAPADRILDTALSRPHFTERHRRIVRAPADVVWAAALSVTSSEIRLLAPFMAVRSLPGLLKGQRLDSLRADHTPFLEVFQKEGFVELYRDEHASQGRAVAIYGAAGRFWSLSGNSPTPLADARDFAQHCGPGTAKVAFSLEVHEHGGDTLVTTETRIVGTDPAARRAFGRYWLIIRGPSGLIRRSWLAAIDRRARA